MKAVPGPDQWAGVLEDVIRKERIASVDRVMVVPEAASTQDAARDLAKGHPGLMLIADRQTAGRGRLGRAWNQGGELGLTATFVLSTACNVPERLSLSAGVAAAMAIESAWRELGVEGRAGLRWPNDVVDGGPPQEPARLGPKLAGVLIEAADGIALVGFGVNVNHLPSDFPEPFRSRATSIRAVAAQRGTSSKPLDRLSVAAHLIRSLDRAIRPDFPAVQEWSRRDVLSGSQHTFRHDGRTVKGRVVAIDPLNLITIKTDTGERVQLPALATSLIHDA